MPEDRLYDILRSQATANATVADNVSDDGLASPRSPELAAFYNMHPKNSSTGYTRNLQSPVWSRPVTITQAR